MDIAVIRTRILPELAHRYFQGTDGLDFDVAVVADGPTRVIYSSASGFGEHPVIDADGRMDVFGPSANPTDDSAVYVFHRSSENRGPTAAAGITWFPLLRHLSSDQGWQLVVRHRRGGPLGSFVAEARRRNLAIGFGALLLLVASMTMLVVTSNRAQRLGRLQVDFVTAVSHELRTPLAIIGSAADNLASGVVDNPRRIHEYGTVIGTEVEHLSGLVEDILHFAVARESQQRYTLAVLSVEDLIEATLARSGGLVRASQFVVEREIEAGLPPVKGDPIGLAQCLGNLITNALKYAKDGRWIKIQARLVEQADGRGEVQVSISDRGCGIDAKDLPHIFEPFYRSESVRVAQFQGTGLGLAVAKHIAEAVGGALTVATTPGQGSTFTLHLPAADSDAASAGSAVGQRTVLRLRRPGASSLFTNRLQRPPLRRSTLRSKDVARIRTRNVALLIMDDRDLYSGLIRLHILHHAEKESIFGLGMIEELARHGYRLSAGTLYPILHRLEAKGYLCSAERRHGAKIRRVYRVTPAGRRALAIARTKVRELFGELFEKR